MNWKTFQPYLLALPQTLVFLIFLILPILLIGLVSFWQFNGYAMVREFTLDNYLDIFTSDVYLKTYLNTFKYVVLVWTCCLAIAFPVAYFLAFHIHNQKLQIVLFLVCTVPFWTSNIIRMISWIPVLGKEGLVNRLLIQLNLVEQPVEWLLYSDFAVVLGMVHLFNFFMIAPIFNSMMRIERNLITAAEDMGASGWQILKEVIVPLTAPGIAIGSIFVVTLVMGEFVTVRLMGGGPSLLLMR
jgi:putative spermidine/putrescine transport system permease protein